MAPSSNIVQASCSYTERLTHIHRIAVGIQNRITNRISISRTTPSISCHPPAFELPLIPSLKDQLLGAGAPVELAESLSNAYGRRATELRERTGLLLKQMWDDHKLLPSTSGTSFQDLFNRIVREQSASFEDRLQIWRENVLERVRARRRSPTAGEMRAPPYHKQNHRPFNSDYLPLLEHFFDENPLPSQADKMNLAKKTGMSYHQINVWFQNHRRRNKKDGQSWRKKPGRERPKHPLDDLVQRIPLHIVPKDNQARIHHAIDPDAEECLSDEGNDPASTPRDCRNVRPGDVLDIPAAPHAFPTTYPSDAVDPFPTDASHKLPSPIWMRRPTILPPESRIGIDLEQFMHDFEVKLTLICPRLKRKRVTRNPEKSSKVMRTSIAAPNPDCQAATLFIPTRPHFGRHPALVPSEALHSSVPIHCLRKIPSRTAHSRAFLSSCPRSRHAALLSPKPHSKHPASALNTERRLSPLPKRVASSARGTSLANPEGTSPLSGTIPPTPILCPDRQRKVVSFPTRSLIGRHRGGPCDVLSPSPNLSVLSYDSDSTLSSHSSSSSSPSSTVVTPESSPQVLPEPAFVVPRGSSDPVLSLPAFSGSFGDMPLQFSPLVEGNLVDRQLDDKSIPSVSVVEV